MMPLFLCEEARDSRQTPILVRLFEVRRLNSLGLEARLKLTKLVLVTRGQMNVGGMVVVRSTEAVGMLDARVRCLYRLLCDGDIAVRDGVQVSFG